MAYLRGQDWSAYQSAEPSTKGISFVIIKATEGAGYVNPRMTAQAKHARKAGLIVGFYHFLRPGNMKAQAAYFVSRADSQEGDLLVADWEDAGVSNSDKNEFIAEVQRLRGAKHRVGLYCNVNFWKNKDVGSKCGDFLWIAHYGVTSGKPGIEDKWTIHQFSDSPVDQNVARFTSKASMRAWADKEPVSPAPSTPAPSPTPAPKPAPKPVSQADKALSIAKAEVGYKEGYSDGHWDNKQKYSPAVPGLEWSQNQAWCATFVSWVAMKAGVASLYPKTASCLTGVRWFKAKGRFSTYPAVGAQVFFGSGGGTHTGIVYAYDADWIYTYEGNTNTSGSAEGNGVYKKKRPRRAAYTYGYGYPAFTEGIKSADPAYKGQAPKPAPDSDKKEEITGMSAKEINAAVWNSDTMPAPPSSSTYEDNKTWKASSYLKEQYERTLELQKAVEALTASVAALSAKVDAMGSAE